MCFRRCAASATGLYSALARSRARCPRLASRGGASSVLLDAFRPGEGEIADPTLLAAAAFETASPPSREGPLSHLFDGAAHPFEKPTPLPTPKPQAKSHAMYLFFPLPAADAAAGTAGMPKYTSAEVPTTVQTAGGALTLRPTPRAELRSQKEDTVVFI
ncbi:hypothetical protein GGTG_06040 [Gaeumannomyces tritici R3-111a-1]|uniref:Uncharacterized protein n=1 Tax=Gaeumannomyces tritici (strain R3-111a-1) TaxID=644352 RepID=J3NXN4_GAET3|nr:hypothetical protein GGTG_06040 [Gaeumannomyces tritici R3-111a-1]EJT76116.1 hypothetical protein GGTG_06040 [Gaeumannomyces tritici R3-111a-1]